MLDQISILLSAESSRFLQEQLSRLDQKVDLINWVNAFDFFVDIQCHSPSFCLLSVVIRTKRAQSLHWHLAHLAGAVDKQQTGSTPHSTAVATKLACLPRLADRNLKFHLWGEFSYHLPAAFCHRFFGLIFGRKYCPICCQSTTCVA